MNIQIIVKFSNRIIVIDLNDYQLSIRIIVID